jgi:hypothetical protein
MLDHEVSCPRCKALRGQPCHTPTGMPYYKRVTVRDKTTKVRAVHAARKRRRIVEDELFSDSPVRRFRHRHPAVHHTRTLESGCKVLHVRFGTDREAG